MSKKNGPVCSARGLGFAVFSAGAVLMCVEIVGGLTIAPYFGSNVFVWGSVISVFMGALALGYMAGGKAADAGPRAWMLGGLLGAAGVLVLLVPWLGPVVNRALLEADLGQWLNPLRALAAVAALFFLPSMLLGMISPIAVRIASTGLGSIGRVVGRLYALNTLGSVGGALATTFVLTVFLGNRAILFGCGGVLVLAAAAVALMNRTTAAGARAPKAETNVAAPARSLVPGLRPMVFACGMVLMSLEIVGGAEIAPYFGSSVFVWGSVITVCLCAMALGYRLGGRLADRRPAMDTLAAVVVAAGVATLVIPMATPAVCRTMQAAAWGGGLNVLRPLVAAAVLYAVPVMLFAMVAPFAVRLSTAGVRAAGGVAGRLYALSTLGNMVGVLLTTFVLISAIGKTHLLELAGVVTVVAAVEAMLAFNRSAGVPRRGVAVSALLLLAVAGFVLVPKPPLVQVADSGEKVAGSSKGWTVVGQDGYYVLRRILEERESPYHHIAVIEERTLPVGLPFDTDEMRRIDVERTTPYGDRRQLRFDQYVESAVQIRPDNKGDWVISDPYTSGTTYADMLHLPLIFNPDARSVLIIGGGGGVVPTLFKKLYKQMTVDVVEIDPVVVDVAERWFGLVADGRVRVHVQDGRMFVHNSPQKYDLILLDAYTAGGRIPAHLTTREFLEDVRGHLQPNGVVLMNVISPVSADGPKSRLFRAELKTFRAVFGSEHVYAFPKVLTERWTPEESNNVMLIATGPGHARRLGEAEIGQLAVHYCDAKRIGIPKVKEHAANMLTDKELSEVRQDNVPVLTDDYAPVDLMVANLR